MKKIILDCGEFKLKSTNVDDPELLKIEYGIEDLNHMSEVRTYPAEFPEVIVFKIENDNELIGEIKFNRLRWFNRKAELGIIIKKEFQEKGIGKAALKKIIEFAFEKMNLHRLEAEVIEDNARSKKLIEDLGFVFEGELREAKYSKGKYLSVLRYGLLKHESEKTKEN